MTCESNELALGKAIFSRGIFHDINWWPLDIIPKAAFINSEIASIEVPEGVSSIADYAFAGCCTAKEIKLPESLNEFAPKSSDEGDSFNSKITVPEHLYKYIYRLPIMSKINGKSKSILATGML